MTGHRTDEERLAHVINILDRAMYMSASDREEIAETRKWAIGQFARRQSERSTRQPPHEPGPLPQPKVVVRGAAFKTEVRFRLEITSFVIEPPKPGDDFSVATIGFLVSDRETGVDLPLFMRNRLYDPQITRFDRKFDDREFFATSIRRLLMNVLEHELDEALIVDGKRVFEPHAVEPTR